VLVAGYTLVRPTFSTVTSKVENGAVPGAVARVREDAPPRAVEQGPTKHSSANASFSYHVNAVRPQTGSAWDIFLSPYVFTGEECFEL
jgi:hypothetical protein